MLDDRHDSYPSRLLGVRDRPLLLFVRGELALVDADGVAVIGTRSSTLAGERLAGDVAAALAESGRTVVSGLAAGIDSVAHRTALRAGGRSVGVLGTGVRRVYPAANAQLQSGLTAVLSQFQPDDPPARANFPRRNAVMAGMTVATVIVEAGDRSGARIQARHALAQGRPLFLMAPVLERSWARELADRPGVVILHTAQQLIEELSRCPT